MKDIRIKVENLSLYYGEKQALKDVTIEIADKRVTSLIGPSGCGKSSFLRALNRMNDLIQNVKMSGKVLIDGVDIYDKEIDVVNIRKRIGMVFQKSNLFPKSIYDNICFGPRLNGVTEKKKLDKIVENTCIQAAIWDEVKDRLEDSALSLSGGQQQRLCIARTLAIEPEILLLDEPTGALDPISTAKIEELIYTLAKKLTIIMVTHNMQQAARVSDYTAFFLGGELVEFDKTSDIFTNPTLKQTEDYVTGRFG